MGNITIGQILVAVGMTTAMILIGYLLVKTVMFLGFRKETPGTYLSIIGYAAGGLFVAAIGFAAIIASSVNLGTSAAGQELMLYACAAVVTFGCTGIWAMRESIRRLVPGPSA